RHLEEILLISLFDSLSDWFQPRKNHRARLAAKRGGAGRASANSKRPRLRADFRLEQFEPRVLLSAVVTTNQQDYAPGSTALIKATTDGGPTNNFEPGETVHFYVDRTDGVPVNAPPAIQTWDVTDGVGGFT